MVKIIIASLALLLASELVVGSLLLSSAQSFTILEPASPRPIFAEESNLVFMAKPQETLRLLTPERSWKLEGAKLSDEKTLGEFLLAVEKNTNRSPQDAELEIVEGRATKFAPHKDGLVLDLATSRRLILQSLNDGKGPLPLTLPVLSSAPQRKLSDLNTLGIRELVASGQSDFAGSPGNRMHNIRVGAARFNGVIVQPGEEFSFNKYLGPVDGEHGFRPELVIKPEGTVPEFGGGLCQVSTTAFRAAFFGGLPITSRKNHSYAVKYYEWIADDTPRAVGLDATIYPGAQDMKFINDTAATLLVWTRIEGSRLYFDFYGTPDDREVLVDGPHPYNRQPSGAVKSRVSRTVLKDGQKQEVTFNSNYVSPDLYPRIYEFPKVETPPPSQEGQNSL